jgi:hypothetical protein
MSKIHSKSSEHPPMEMLIQKPNPCKGYDSKD